MKGGSSPSSSYDDNSSANDSMTELFHFSAPVNISPSKMSSLLGPVPARIRMSRRSSCTVRDIVLDDDPHSEWKPHSPQVYIPKSGNLLVSAIAPAINCQIHPIEKLSRFELFRRYLAGGSYHSRYLFRLLTPKNGIIIFCMATGFVKGMNVGVAIAEAVETSGDWGIMDWIGCIVDVLLTGIIMIGGFWAASGVMGLFSSGTAPVRWIMMLSKIIAAERLLNLISGVVNWTVLLTASTGVSWSPTAWSAIHMTAFLLREGVFIHIYHRRIPALALALRHHDDLQHIKDAMGIDSHADSSSGIYGDDLLFNSLNEVRRRFEEALERVGQRFKPETNFTPTLDFSENFGSPWNGEVFSQYLGIFLLVEENVLLQLLREEMQQFVYEGSLEKTKTLPRFRCSLLLPSDYEENEVEFIENVTSNICIHSSGQDGVDLLMIFRVVFTRTLSLLHRSPSAPCLIEARSPAWHYDAEIATCRMKQIYSYETDTEFMSLNPKLVLEQKTKTLGGDNRRERHWVKFVEFETMPNLGSLVTGELNQEEIATAEGSKLDSKSVNRRQRQALFIVIRTLISYALENCKPPRRLEVTDFLCASLTTPAHYRPQGHSSSPSFLS